jgi:protein-S-isoprenylcysteine O-methyltransferase Ste14
MIQTATLLLLLNLLYIGLLPRVFFRKDGRLKPMWWATAVPFVACAVYILAVVWGAVRPVIKVETALGAWLELASVPLSAASIALISFTLGTHRAPVSLWHQDDDTPAAIVTHGAYRHIRHPFYAAFLLTLLAAFVHSPHPVTLFALAYGCAILNATAAREEKRLAESPFGADYGAYMKRTGRFLPKWGRHAA